MDCTIPTTLVVKSALTREGLRRILIDNGFGVAQSIACPQELELDDNGDAHIVIYDGSLLSPDDGLAHPMALMAMAPGCRVVLLVDAFDFDMMNRAFAAGVYGYIVQDIPYQSFLAMIQLVSLGEKVAPRAFLDNLAELSSHAHKEAPADVAVRYGLAHREREILDCLVMGMPNKLIARQLGVSEATVKLNVKGIFRKMSVTNRTQAAIMARSDMLPTEPESGAISEAQR